MSEVSSTRLYLGNLPRAATKQDIEDHFAKHGTGKITEIKLMNGFGFVEYEDPMDARDIVPAFHGSDFQGERLTVQFARGPRHKENYGGPPGGRDLPPRPRRTIYRMQITSLPGDTSWQDLKDFARQAQVDVVYSETGRDRDGKGFVEFENAADLKTAVEKLDKREFKGAVVECTEDVQQQTPMDRGSYRQRSPPPRTRYPGGDDFYDRRGPPPPRYDRERSPRGDYRGRPDDYYAYGRRTPPLRDPYPPPPRRDYFDHPYERDSRGPPGPPRGYESYVRNGYPEPGRPRSPPPRGYGGYPGGYGGYDDRRW